MLKTCNIFRTKLNDRIKVNGHSEIWSSLEIWCYIHWNAFRTRSYITRCSIECWYTVVPVFFLLKLTFFPEMAGETERQTYETVNSLKRKIALPSLYCYEDFVVLIIPDQFNCWCLFSFKIQSAIVVVIVTRLGSV